jgi:hypothetical protein
MVEEGGAGGSAAMSRDEEIWIGRSPQPERGETES